MPRTIIGFTDIDISRFREFSKRGSSRPYNPAPLGTTAIAYRLSLPRQRCLSPFRNCENKERGYGGEDCSLTASIRPFERSEAMELLEPLERLRSYDDVAKRLNV
jgi:hypothetical protein